jgi:predicted metalloprotease with PDZ domain
MDSVDTPAKRTLRHRPNARITVRYRVAQESAEYLRSVRGNPYRAVIQPTYFHLIGHAALIVPNLNDKTPAKIRVHELPKSWSFASDLEHPGTTLDQVQESISVGGDFRILHPASHNPALRLAIHGSWSFDVNVFAARLARILEAEQRFWGSETMPFLVTVMQLPGNPGSTSSGGTGLDDAFAFFATPNVPEASITRTLTHEGMHSWIPRRIGGLPEKDEELSYWLSEGFTEFYVSRLLVHEGLWTPLEFARDLNQTLRAYGTSPVRTAGNARILADFWRDNDVQQLPYQRGQLLAHLWDEQLRARGGLDPIMMKMQKRAATNSHSDPNMFATRLFFQTMTEAGHDVRNDITRYVDQGSLVTLPETLFAPCGRIETRDVPLPDPGFDLSATIEANKRIVGVDAASRAYAAGLRDGMQIIKREAGAFNESETELALRVDDAGTERVIRYLPQSKSQVPVQRLVIDPALDEKLLNLCRNRLAGAQ